MIIFILFLNRLLFKNVLTHLQFLFWIAEFRKRMKNFHVIFFLNAFTFFSFCWICFCLRMILSRFQNIGVLETENVISEKLDTDTFGCFWNIMMTFVIFTYESRKNKNGTLLHQLLYEIVNKVQKQSK